MLINKGILFQINYCWDSANSITVHKVLEMSERQLCVKCVSK